MEKNNTIEQGLFGGTGLKFLLHIESEGFSMADNDFKIIVKNIRHEKEIKKEDMHLAEDEGYIFTIDTNEFGAGEYIMKTFAYVPDSDFEGGIRTEVQKQLLCVVMP